MESILARGSANPFAEVFESNLKESEKEPDFEEDGKPKSQLAKELDKRVQAAEDLYAQREAEIRHETNPVIKFCRWVGLESNRYQDDYGLELNRGLQGTVKSIDDFPEHLDLAYSQVQRKRNGLPLDPRALEKLQDYGLNVIGAACSLKASTAWEGRPGKLKKGTWTKQRNNVPSKTRAFPAHSTRNQKVSAEAWIQKTLPEQGMGLANSNVKAVNTSRPSLKGLDLASSAGVNVKGIKQSWTVRPGQEWKQQVFGTAQKTGTSGHATRSYRTAIEQVKNNPQKIALLNRGLKRATGEPIRQRPDVTVVEMVDNNVKIHQFEVPSKTDDVVKLMERMEKSSQKMSTKKRGENKIKHINKGKLND